MSLLQQLIEFYYKLKLVLDRKEYGVNDEAFHPRTGKRMSWIEYEEMRRQAKLDLIISASNGGLKRVTKEKN
jgi:hypothetical protein